MKMISTSTHKNFYSNQYITCDITGFWDREILCHPYDKSYPALEPKYMFWKKWKQNIENLSKEENDKHYVEQYYEQVLSKLDPEKVYNEIGVEEKFDGSILICDDEITRHVVAAWFHLLLGIEVSDCGVIQNIGRFVFDKCSAPGMYAEKIETYLEAVMREKCDMKGFHSLRALYLFERGEALEQRANEYDGVLDALYLDLMFCANQRKKEAEEAEAEYRKQIEGKQKKK